MTLGPIMLGLEGLVLQPDERELLQHPLVGGVILFTRNYQSVEQVSALTSAIRAARDPGLLIAVDHEGGRVQRFRQGFTELPAARHWGEVYDRDRSLALQMAQTHGWLLASELRAVDIDFSFAPVLDLDVGATAAVGNRAFHHDAGAVGELAAACARGMATAGMAAVGKHFPGHGHVATDSHLELPLDQRSLQQMEQSDLLPFRLMIDGGLPAILPALVVYSEVDRRPACFSELWLKRILREQLKFTGAVFSDDLGMAGAAFAGGPLARADAALAAGCDMVLACNERSAAIEMLDGLAAGPDPAAQQRLARMRGSEAEFTSDHQRAQILESFKVQLPA